MSTRASPVVVAGQAAFAASRASAARMEQDDLAGRVEWRLDRRGDTRTDRLRPEPVDPGEDDPSVREERGVAGLVGEAELGGLAERSPFVQADPPPDVPVGDRLEVVDPGEADEAAVLGHGAALVPVRDPAGRIRHDGDRLGPAWSAVVRPQVDHALQPLRRVEVRLVGLDAQQQPAARELEDARSSGSAARRPRASGRSATATTSGRRRTSRPGGSTSAGSLRSSG